LRKKKPASTSIAASPKILVLDIETSPIEGIFWRLGEQRINHDQVQKDWSILSYCAKWVGSETLYYQDTGGRGPSKTRDDSRLLTPIHSLLDEADIVVGQNVKRFDLRKIRARLIENGYKPFSPVRVVDTYKEADKLADFTSHKLEWLTAKLAKTQKDKHKEFPGLELWKECLKDNPKAWAAMRKYNPTDVISTEEVYLVLAPWMDTHPNRGVYTESDGCSVCGSMNLIPRKGTYAYTQAGKYQRYVCGDCGKWNRGKENLIPKEARKGLRTN
jgi:hypothetical protein